LNKQYKVVSTIISDFKIYYKTVEIKTAWYWPENRQINKWNKGEKPRNRPTVL
jgi:phosphoribosyl-AMP cyclohydrolase